MSTKGLKKCVLNEEYQKKMETIKQKLEELHNLVSECNEHMPALSNTKLELENALESLEIAEEHYGLK